MGLPVIPTGITVDGFGLLVERFPDGTPHILLKRKAHAGSEARVSWLYGPDEEFILYCVIQHLCDKYEIKTIKLFVPYLPNARMDRVHHVYEVFTLQHICRFLNGLHVDEIIVRDVHSSVGPALLDRVRVESVSEKIQALCERLLTDSNDMIFFPDESARKRYEFPWVGKYPMGFGIKRRNWETGEILGMSIFDQDMPKQPRNVLMIDDISSYGGSFYFAGKQLKEEYGVQEINLYVTHCENSILQGKLITSGIVKQVYTTQSIFTGEIGFVQII